MAKTTLKEVCMKKLAVNMNVYRLSKQMAYIITLVKKEENNGKTEEE